MLSSGLMDPRGVEAAAGRRRSGFTLLEILVVMALLSFIVLGLMAMFNQTQKAFNAGLMQTDTLEAGRLATDLLGREVEGITPAYFRANYPSQPGFYAATNFYVELEYSTYQSLPSVSGNMWRTNILDDLFFLSRENQTWTGIGYFVRTNRTLGPFPGPVCTLYRYEASVPVERFNQYPAELFAGFNFARWTTNELSTVSKIIDGVVHFQVRPSDPAGWVIPTNPSWWAPYANYPSAVYTTNLSWLPNPFQVKPPSSVPRPQPDPYTGEFLRFVFVSNAVPAFVEFELGVLEQQTLQRYKSLPTAERQREFLAGQAGRVHVFRQRVAVRNLDPLAYQ